MGRALTRKEFGRSIDHRPKSPASGRIICWDNSSWKGCQNKSRPHSHKSIGKVGLLDRPVQMQLIKRGGAKGGPKVGSHEEADKRLAALQKEKETEDESKRAGEAAAPREAPGGPKPGAKKVGECAVSSPSADQPQEGPLALPLRSAGQKPRTG